MTAPLFKDQAKAWLKRSASRKRSPVRPKTIQTYQSQIETNLNPKIGRIPVDLIDNKQVSKVVADLASRGLSANTIQLNINIIKQIRASVVDSDGQQLYPMTWNAEVIDAPIPDKKTAKTPIASAAVIQAGLSCPSASSRAKALLAILAGTGMRIQEAMALKIGYGDGTETVWIPEESKIIVRVQRNDKYMFGPAKTAAGEREIDLCSALNVYLQKNVTYGPSGLFAKHDYRLAFPLSENSYRKEFKSCGVLGGFHSLRRFRVTYLRLQGVPDAMIHFWIGHGGESVTDTYTKVGPEIAHRKQQAERAGLGFGLETV